jgi:DNA-binding transcriptional LysR family regulator
LIQAMICLFDVAALLGEFHHRYPQIQLTVSDQGSHQMVDAVRSGDLDIAFVGLHTDELPPDIAGRLLVVDPEVAVIRNDGVVDDPVSLHDLALQYEFLEFRSSTGLRSRVDAAFAAAGVPRTSRFELAQLENLVRFAANGLGVALVPASVAVHYLRDDASTGVVAVAEPIVHPISVIFAPPQPAAPSARAFLDLLDSRIS